MRMWAGGGGVRQGSGVEIAAKPGCVSIYIQALACRSLQDTALKLLPQQGKGHGRLNNVMVPHVAIKVELICGSHSSSSSCFGVCACVCVCVVCCIVF